MANVSTTKMSSKGQNEFETLIAKARKKGKEAGILKSDINDAIAKVRRKRK